VSEHTHVFCPGCREDSDTLAARDQSIAASQEIATELFDVVEAAGAATPELQRRVRERLAAIGGQPATPDPRDEQIATLREGLAQASEAVAHLLDLYNPDGLDDPGPNIPSDLLRWRALLAPPAIEQEPAVREGLTAAQMLQQADRDLVTEIDAVLSAVVGGAGEGE
jgi:hypothetical protein